MKPSLKENIPKSVLIGIGLFIPIVLIMSWIYPGFFYESGFLRSSFGVYFNIGLVLASLGIATDVVYFSAKTLKIKKDFKLALKVITAMAYVILGIFLLLFWINVQNQYLYLFLPFLPEFFILKKIYRTQLKKTLLLLGLSNGLFFIYFLIVFVLLK